MVSTRRSTANANRVLVDTKEPKVVEPPRDTISVKKRPKKKAKGTLDVTKSPVIPSVSAIQGDISGHGINPTSPTADEVSKTLGKETLGMKAKSTGLFHQGISDSQKRVTKPLAGMSGSCQDPIIVNENSSSPPTTRPPKRKRTEEQPAEPHRFIANGYRDLYTYGASRSAFARSPPKKSKHNSHQSHDIYKAINEKRATDTYHNHNALRASAASAFPFQAPYHPSARTIAYQPIHPNCPPSYAQYYQHPALPVHHYTIVSQSEEMLRKEATRYIQEFSRTSPHRQKLFSTASHETRSSEADQRNSHHGFSKDGLSGSPQISPYAGINPIVQQNFQPSLFIHALTKHTSLLASLLQIYPYSTDQKGLLEDIRAMALIQNHHLITWLDSLSPGLRRQKERSSDSAIGLDPQSRPIGGLPVLASNEKDMELRRFFAATAAMWQDGTGHGVTDVFRTRPSFTPTPSTANPALSPEQSDPNHIQPGEGAENHIAMHVTTTATERARRTATPVAKATISPTTSSQYIPVEKKSDGVPRK